jgi:hypothetical protein
MMLRAIDIVLVTKDADGHSRTRNTGEFDSSRETLVTLRIIILEADLELNGLQKVPLLGVVGIVQEFLYVRTHTGDLLSVRCQ